MDWVKLSSRYYADAKVLEAGPTAELLFVRSLAYCGEQEKGGLVPTSALPMLVLGLPANARTKGPAALVTVGLWETVDGGWVIPGWDDYQVGVEQLAARRASTRDRVARHRRRKAATRAGLPTATTDQEHPSHTADDDPAGGEPPAPADARPGDVDLPPAVTILRAALEAHRLNVRWDTLTNDQITLIDQLVATHGDTTLVKAALAVYRPDRPAAFAQAWIGHWQALPAPGQRLAALDTPCDQPGHSGTTRHCPQCAADAHADDTTPRRKARR